MKYLLTIVFSLAFVCAVGQSNLTATSPVIRLFPQRLTENKNGGVINKGDTVRVTILYSNNGSNIRNLYFDFQHQISALNLIDVEWATPGAGGSALPAGVTTSFVNNYYPGYNWVDNTNNQTEDGLRNAQFAQYAFVQGQQRAINRITLQFATPNGNTVNLRDGDLCHLRFRVTETVAGFSYDSIYLNFVYGWDAAGAVRSVRMPRENASTWVDVNPSSNALINGDLKLNSNLPTPLQPVVVVVDSASNNVRAIKAVNSNGTFTLANEVVPNTPYKAFLAVPSDSIPSILTRAVTISDFTIAQQEFIKQNLDGSYTNQLIASGIGFLAADVNGDGKFDGGDLNLLFAQAVGADTIITPIAGQSLYNLPAFLGTTFDTLTFNGFRNISDRQTVLFRTRNSVQDLTLKYVIPGDINRSHSSLRIQPAETTTYGIATEGFVNTPDLSINSINLNLNNLTVTSNSIEIPFSLDTKGNRVSALQFEIVYDPTRVKFEDIRSSLPNTWFVFVNSTQGKIRFGAIDREIKNTITGAFIPFRLRFTSIGAGVDLNTKIRVTANLDAANEKGAQLGINLNTTTIKLTGYNHF